MFLQFKKFRTLPLLATAFVLLLLYSCDMLESDVSPVVPEVEFEGGEIYIAKNGTGIIDLNAMIKSTGAARLDVTGKPAKGTLSKLSNSVLQYVPGSDFSNGRDAFEFSIYGRDNSFIGKDTVIIIVEPDSTQLPCGIYPLNDVVKGVTGTVTIPVLNNDILCGDLSNYAVEVYQPNNSYPPSFGTATVQANAIRYTPGPNFAGTDSIVYKVYDVRDTARWGIARVFISKATSACTFEAYPDNFVIRRDSISSDTVFLNIFQNDQLCNRPVSNYQFTLLDDGHVGTATYNNSGLQYRIPPSTQTLSDSAAYKLCYGGRCETAKVYIQVKE
ncbi:MAG TPA: Ig-like domain-containing protein [Chryseosolibacter sp.]